MSGTRISVRALTAAALSIGVCRAAISRAGDESIVQTPQGPVQGLVMDTARAFLGIPYAAPPVNAGRWLPPAASTPWGPSTLQAVHDPPGCIQVCNAGNQPPHVCPLTTSEDCLYLNVWTPRLANITEPLPVIIWIHGGAFKDGYAGGTQGGIVYDSSSWVNATTAIVVPINYRLGSFGFLYSGQGGIQGNVGLMDQEAAMAWVKANIAGFGGDPARITIVGQSAGAMSIASHLTRPETAGAYQAAVMHSNPLALPFRDPAAGLDLANTMAGKANCSDGSSGANWTVVEACLRALDAPTLLAAQEAAAKDVTSNWRRIVDTFVPWVPVYGTAYLPLAPLTAFVSGQVVDVPLVLGSVRDEGALFINGAFNTSLGELEYIAALEVIIGLGAGVKVNAQYPVPSPAPADLRPHMAGVATDALFVCPLRNATASLVQAPGRASPVWLYTYQHVTSFNPAIWGPRYPFIECWPLVCHAADLVQLFHPNYPQFGTNYTASENALTLTQQWYWSTLAATGKPGVGSPLAPLSWPAYTASGRPTLLFSTDPSNSILADFNGVNCDFWDAQVGYDFY